MTRALTLADITDLRAYEREREEFRERIIALKKRRRIPVGPFVTFLFESRDTIRFQIQEMARAERIATDSGIEVELGIYNPLIPEPGELRATMFIELTSDAELREWLPKLVGIETRVAFALADGSTVRCEVDPDHAAQLTREDTTAAVHYIGWTFSDPQREAFGAGEVELVVDHDEYRHATSLTDENLVELRSDLGPDS